MKKYGIIAAALIALIATFQNCSAHDFSGVASQTSASTAAVSNLPAATSNPVAIATPVVVATPLPAATPIPAPQCLTYFLNGNPGSSGSYAGNYVVAGTKIYQKVACNGRGMDVGYQASYCTGGMAECNDCGGGAATYVCQANGYWAPSN